MDAINFPIHVVRVDRPKCVFQNKAIFLILGIILLYTDLSISEFIMGKVVETDNIGPLITIENVAAIYCNMDTIGGYVQARFIALNNYINSKAT